MVYTENKLSPKLNWIINCCYCSVAQLCLTPCTCMNCSIPGFSVLHHLLKLAYIHWITYAIQPSYPLSFPSPPAFNNQCRIIIICEEIGFFFPYFLSDEFRSNRTGQKERQYVPCLYRCNSKATVKFFSLLFLSETGWFHYDFSGTVW